MPNKFDELSRLINDIAESITITESNDVPELEKIQKLLDQVRQNISQSDISQTESLTKAIGVISSADTNLSAIINDHSSDSAKLFDAVSCEMASLQSLINEAINAPATVAAVAAAEPSTAEAIKVNEDDVPLVLDFINESKEHIESAETGLLQLESTPGDAEAINKIFRAFHTIKGMAGFLNLTHIGSLAHSAENLLDRARKGTLQLQGDSMDVTFASLDCLKKMLSTLKECLENGTPVEPGAALPQLLAQLQACNQGQSIAAAAPVQNTTAQTTDVQATAASQPSSAPSGTACAQTAHHVTDDKIKVSTSKLDNLINMIGELVIAQSMVSQQIKTTFSPEHDLCRKIGHQGKIIRELQELSMSLRMVPIQGVFQKMARLVRDLSHKAQKNVSFETAGEETEIDRNIVDLLADPLVHMVRNSVDHGIESAQEREDKGKNPVGKVNLRAFHQGGNIFVEISDDGKGLDKQRILKKAIENGIVQPGEELSDQEIFRLIFHAGLSTAEKVTDISGRGVGMDVVRKNIEALHGKIEITSEIGKGTTFSIRLPLTLAIIDGQIIKVGVQKFILPIMSIEHSLRPLADQLSTVQGTGEVVNLRGRLLPMFRLHKLFNMQNACEDPTKGSLVVIEGDNRKCCLLVDELLGQQQVVIKNLGDSFGDVKGISGAAIMGDGAISLILDTASIIDIACK